MTSESTSLSSGWSSDDSASSPALNGAVAFFPQAQHFVVSGGHFTTNHVTTEPRDLHRDFRKIPLGDLDLQRKIQGGGGNVIRRHQRGAVRSIYSARVVGHEPDMTAAIYQGDNAEEDWRREIAKYKSLRHPNFVQLYGIVSSCDLYAMVFYDDLIPVTQVLELFRDSPISTMYLYTHCYNGFTDAQDYFLTISGTWLGRLDCTFWIRRSTGQLCVALSPNSPDTRIFFPILGTLSCSPISSLDPNLDSRIISSLSLAEYHERVYCYTSRTHRFSLSAHTSLRPGVVVLPFKDTPRDTPVEIAAILDCDIEDTGWKLTSGSSPATVLPVMTNGWTRFTSADVAAGLHRKIKYRGPKYCWFTQANHVFTRPECKPKPDNYVFVDEVGYYLQFSKPTKKPPSGYLFICPLEDLKEGLDVQPPAYWSLDLCGTKRVSSRELGLPPAVLFVKAWGQSWDHFLYAGLRQFYGGKGFDPESQDIARHLGFPLYRLVFDPPTRVEEESLEPSGDEIGLPKRRDSGQKTVRAFNSTVQSSSG